MTSTPTQNIERYLEYVREHPSIQIQELLSESNGPLLVPPESLGLTGSPNSLNGNDEAFHLITNIMAIDCEMISTVSHKKALARVSVVNVYGKVVYDVYVRPRSRVLYYNTKYSGISPQIFERARRQGNLVDFSQASQRVRELFSDRIMVGHAVKNEMDALEYFHSEDITVDTQRLPRISKAPGLKRAMGNYFNIPIQTGSSGHDSVEDARATMLLLRTFYEEYMPVFPCLS